MADGLSWELELKANLGGIDGMAKGLKQTDEALKKVDSGLKGVEGQAGRTRDANGRFIGGLKQTGQEAERLGGGLEKLGGKTGGLMSMFKQVALFEIFRRGVSGAIDLAEHLAHKVFEIGGEMLDAAAKAERTEVSFKLLMGAEGGKETLEWIEKISKFTEFTDDELKGIAGGLAKVGFEGDALTRAVAASIDMAAFSGSGAAGADAASNALEMVMRTGEVSPRALKGLGLKKEDFFAEMTRRTGLGAAALKEKIDAGKIDTEESLEALYSMIGRKTGKDLGGAGVEMSKTMQARLKHLKDLPDQFYQQLAGTKGFSKISDFVGQLVEAFDPESAMGQKISVSLTSLVDTIGDVLGEIDIADLAGKLDRGITAIVSNVRPAIAVFSEFWDILKKVGSAYLKVVDIFHDYTPIGFIADLIGDNAAKKAGLGTSALGDKMVGKDGAAMRAELRRRGGAIGISLPEGAAEGVIRGTPALQSVAPMMSSALVEPVRSELGVRSPSKVFEDIGMMTGLGFQQGVQKSAAATQAVMQDAFGAPSSVGGAAGARGNVEVNLGGIHVAVSGAGGDAKQTADTIASKIHEIAPGLLQSAIERLAIQAGGV